MNPALRLSLALASAAAFPALATAQTLFSTSLGSAAVDPAGASELNAVTTGGTWSTNFIQSGTVSRIVANAGNTDHAYLFDENLAAASAAGTYIQFSLTNDASFASVATTFSFDFFHSRQGANKTFDVIGYGADDVTAVFKLRIAVPSNGLGVSAYTPTDDISGAGTSMGPNVAIASTMAASGAYDPTLMRSYQVVLSGTSLQYSAEGFTTVSSTVLNSQTTLSSVRIAITGSSTGDQGFWLDNVELTAVPEPATYALFAGLCILGFALWRRRR